jgi:protein TonB
MSTLRLRTERPIGAVAAVVALHLAILLGLLATRPTVLLPKPRNVVEVALLEPPTPPRVLPPPAAPVPPRKVPPPVPAVAPPPVTPTAEQPVVEPVAPVVPMAAPEAIRLPAADAEPAVQSLPAPPAPAPAAVQAPFVPPSFSAAYLNNPAPAYPPVARRTRQTGRVLLLVDVSADGRAMKVEVSQSSGHESLDEAAMKAVRLWRFVPARRAGTAVAASVQVPISFALDP